MVKQIGVHRRMTDRYSDTMEFLPGNGTQATSLTEGLLRPKNLASGEHTKNHGTSPFLIGKSMENHHF